MLTIITDDTTARGPWLYALHDGGPQNVTSALAKEWDDWTIIVSTKTDKWKDLWETAASKNLTKLDTLKADGSDVFHTLVLAPSHGVDNGTNLQWLPRVGTTKVSPTNIEGWNESKVHAKELPVGVAIEMAIIHGFDALHVHCCNVGMHLQTYRVHYSVLEPLPKILRVTAFKQIVWESYNCNAADKWLVGGLKQRAMKDDKYVIPRGDGWLFRFQIVGEILGLTKKAIKLGAMGKRGRE